MCWFTTAGMKTLIRSIRTFFIVMFLFPFPVFGETITLVADEWPPFNSVPGSAREGFLVDVARTVFSQNGIGVSYRLLPWKRALEITDRTGLPYE